MSSDAVTYDEVLPERATVETVDGEPIDWAIAGDTIEVLCPEPMCIKGLVEEPDDGYHEGYRWEPCATCRGAGTLRVRLTEDPREVHKAPGIHVGDGFYKPGEWEYVGWRHIGTVVE